MEARGAGQGKQNSMRGQLRLGIGLVGVLVLLALLSAVWTPFMPEQMRMAERLQGPGWQHWLGTDHFGRDLFSQLLVGARHTLAIAGLAVAGALLLGVPLGLLATLGPRGVDEAISRAADAVFAFPALLTALLLAAVLRPGAGNAVLAIGLFHTAVFTRVTRNAAHGIWRREFPRAALALGRHPLAVAVVHVLPNIAGVLAVQASVALASAILAEAALSYLGLGVPPPQPSWGRMLNDAQSYLFQEPRLALLPGGAIALAVLAFTLLGDGLRDRFDPRSVPGG